MSNFTRKNEGQSDLNIADQFDGIELSPNFKPVKAAAKSLRDDYIVALTGPAAFMQSAPKAETLKRAAPRSDDTTPVLRSSEPMVPIDDALKGGTVRTSMGKPIIALAALASIACVTFLGFQSLRTATANASFAFAQSSSIDIRQKQDVAAPVGAVPIGLGISD